MPARPRTSCSACRRLKRVCVRDSGEACEGCVRAGRACDLAGVAKDAKRQRPQEPAAEAGLTGAVVAPPRRAGFVSEEMGTLTGLALRSNAAWSMVRPEAVRAALQLANSVDLCSSDGVTARAMLHAAAAVGGLATCDPRFATTARSNLCQARALALSPAARGNALLPFVHLALAETSSWCRDFPGMLERWCMAGLSALWETPPPALRADGDSVNCVLPRVARAAVATATGPYLSDEEAEELNALKPGGSLLELMRFLSLSCPERVPDMDLGGGNFKRPPRRAAHVAWGTLSAGTAAERVLKVFMASNEVLIDSLQARLLLPPPPTAQLRMFIEACGVEAAELGEWQWLLTHIVRAVCHYHLGELAPAVHHSEAAFAIGLEDPRTFGAGILQGSFNALINMWRADRSGAGAGLPLDRVMVLQSAVVETLHAAAKSVTPAAQHVPAAYPDPEPPVLDLEPLPLARRRTDAEDAELLDVLGDLVDE